MTWTRVEDQLSSNNGTRLSLFRGISASAVSTPLTFTVPGTADAWAWTVVAVTGADASGTGASAAVGNVADDPALQVTLPAFTSLSNGVLAGFAHLVQGFTTLDAEAGYTPTTPQQTVIGAFNLAHRVEWRSTNETTPSMTSQLSGATGRVGVAIELRHCPTTVAVTGAGAIASGETFGGTRITLAAQGISAAGAIATQEAFGGPTLLQLLQLSPEGIASEEAFGGPSLSVGSITVTVGSIPGAEEFGSLIIGFPSGILQADGIASEEAFGSSVVSLGAVGISPTGISTSEAFGTAFITQVRYLYPIAVESATAFGTPLTYNIYRWRRLRSVQYHAFAYNPDSNGGPGTIKLELDPHILNLVWSQTQNLAGQAAFALARRNPVLDQIEWMVDHIKIFRETAAGTSTVFAGKLVQPVLSAFDCFAYCLDYAGFLQLSLTGYRTAYPNKKIGSEIIAPEWSAARVGESNSPFVFVTTGTIENPRGQDGTTEITTNADFGVVLFDRLFTFNTLAEMSMANTSNNVKFEITRTPPHIFNWWRNYGTNKTEWAGVMPGNVSSYDFDGGKDGQRNHLTTVISDGAGGQMPFTAVTSDAATTPLRRLQASVAIRTLFGATGGTTETDQGKAALLRQLTVSRRYPRQVRVSPRQGEFPLFLGNDLGDRFRVTVEKPSKGGDFYDGYLLWQQVVGAWEPSSGGELLDLYLRGQA